MPGKLRLGRFTLNGAGVVALLFALFAEHRRADPGPRRQRRITTVFWALGIFQH
jgi:hypothetical protein